LFIQFACFTAAWSCAVRSESFALVHLKAVGLPDSESTTANPLWIASAL